MTTREFDFEVAFVTEPLDGPDDERIDRAMELIPNLVVSFDGNLTVVTTLVHAADAIEAGVKAAKALEASGIPVIRTYQDLVTRQDIAERIGVTRQAVGNWVRGERHDDVPFPAPVSLVAGGIWLWGDVAGWARSRNYEVEDVSFPSLDAHNRIDLLISAGIGSVTVTTYECVADIAFRHRGTKASLGHTYQRSYAPAS
ncbi:helix-turn-helix domain-containing protein [Mycolicibacterium smegmatis]|jgi:hypothetical protein|uniref:Uncharacterized protein n=3 Tax=Mycolicibacterium smegmatis TaxID=1772 RepID=I7FIF4_MYCS2|nr:helix-turn-helix transcriptional regulator [Mycolicibacterium smegmatis]ABK75449.1 conserved hypothetical protein [Mycolicibacterium smegmatis MC2 155]AFP38563.1 hypothetical protein MSMEI_2093 [Mycolicibacterium smegmatis MC2 155]AIU07347.1 hypothetical protein LJ00_10680 [Mycolicibacterium smegmatis MC2 155]AIU13972.1 hypothetical protein LI99_10680 [Mycolicibacterium smegmatis]AIU20596.1 hypothetical protein LI98_10680 [Mycolicibacterium smegmatis]